MRRHPKGTREGGRFASSLDGKNPPSTSPLPSGRAAKDQRDTHEWPAMLATYPPFAEMPAPSPPRPLLTDLFPQQDYQACVDDGLVSVRRHPRFPYLIHNYTPRCVWEGQWNEVTLTCRGLITHAESGEVVARPFRKFFNYEQVESHRLGWDEEVVVFDKADGSLGVLYPTPTGDYQVATRGSFTSDQAQWASEFYTREYAHRWEPNPHWTYLYEIVYPQNRVVLDYGDTEELVLLGAVDVRSGVSVPVDEACQGWPGVTVEQFPHRTLREVVAAPPRENAEGFVVWHPPSDTRVKVKQEDYKRLHKLLTGVTPKHVWEVLADGQDPSVVFADAPDEFHAWVRKEAATLRDQHQSRLRGVLSAYERLQASLPEDYDRRSFARAVGGNPDKSLMFLLLDGRAEDVADRVWQQIRPSGDSPGMRTQFGDAD